VGPNGGRIFVHGEIWRAVSSLMIPKGQPVKVRSLQGLTCQVEPLPPSGR
jgi:membrane-bound serine protease (ClpP class)